MKSKSHEDDVVSDDDVLENEAYVVAIVGKVDGTISEKSLFRPGRPCSPRTVDDEDADAATGRTPFAAKACLRVVDGGNMAYLFVPLQRWLLAED